MSIKQVITPTLAPTLTLRTYLHTNGLQGTGWNDPLFYPPEELEDGVMARLASTPNPSPNRRPNPNPSLPCLHIMEVT